MPTVSVVMTLYNSERFIGEAIHSALAQSHRDLEIIVIDDGSTDGSAEIAKGFGSAIRYVYQENSGAARSTNNGVRLSSGPYIAFLENDDVWLPDKVAQQVSVLEANPGAGAVNCDLRYITEDGVVEEELIKGYCPDEPYSELFLKGFNFMLSALLVRREVFEATGGFDEGFQAAGLQDVEWYARLMQVADVHYIPRPLTLFRRHEVRIPSEVRIKNEQYLLDRLWARFKGDPRKRRYILARRVSYLSDLGKWKINLGRFDEGRQDLRMAIRLALAEKVSGKMLFRSIFRLVKARMSGTACELRH